jgi:anti-sigma regulatory factor (Ser/Thr protein kinase)
MRSMSHPQSTPIEARAARVPARTMSLDATRPQDAARPRFAEISTAFPTVPESVAAARRFVAVSLRRFGFADDTIDRAILVTSELVANAFATGRPPIRIRVRSVTDTRAMVEVTHGADDALTDEDELGRDGLQLGAAARRVVDSMATRWGARPFGSGVMAWFEIDDPAPAGSAGAGPHVSTSPA